MPSSPKTDPPGTVRIVSRQVTADVLNLDRRGDALLRRQVPAVSRERRVGGGWIVYGSKLAPLLTALEAAGYRVERVSTLRATAAPIPVEGSATSR